MQAAMLIITCIISGIINGMPCMCACTHTLQRNAELASRVLRGERGASAGALVRMGSDALATDEQRAQRSAMQVRTHARTSSFTERAVGTAQIVLYSCVSTAA